MNIRIIKAAINPKGYLDVYYELKAQIGEYAIVSVHEVLLYNHPLDEERIKQTLERYHGKQK